MGIIIGLILWLLMGRSVLALEPTVTDFWNGKAEFDFSFKLTETNMGLLTGSEGGVHIEVMDNNWYLFTRKVNWDDKPVYCGGKETMTTEVRKSTDFGKTWNIPITVVPSECAATDGDAYYNSSENRWHYLYQCLGRSGGWSGCHATRDGSDPYGQFVPDSNNPVINSGEIWSKICDTMTDDCKKISNGDVIDEGTFDIFDFKDGEYYVDFHGYDGKNGYRGIAKTEDFNNWTLVANDSTLDSNDAKTFMTNWDANGPIGFGAGTVLKDGEYYYLASEATDKNLVCTSGQNWVVGMFRSSNLESTSWEKLPKGNPFFTVDNFPKKDTNQLPCYPAYTRLFRGNNGKTYLHTSMTSFDKSLNGIYFYELHFIGDNDGNGVVDLLDFEVWKEKYLAGNSTLVEFEIWKSAYLNR